MTYGWSLLNTIVTWYYSWKSSSLQISWNCFWKGSEMWRLQLSSQGQHGELQTALPPPQTILLVGSPYLQGRDPSPCHPRLCLQGSAKSGPSKSRGVKENCKTLGDYSKASAALVTFTFMGDENLIFVMLLQFSLFVSLKYSRRHVCFPNCGKKEPT